MCSLFMDLDINFRKNEWFMHACVRAHAKFLLKLNDLSIYVISRPLPSPEGETRAEIIMRGAVLPLGS